MLSLYLQHLPLTHALKGFFFSVLTCSLVDVNQPLPWVLCSFPVSQALGGGKCRHLSYFSTILLQDPTPLHVKIIRSTKLLIICWRKLKLTYLLTESYNHISFFNTRSQLVWVLASSSFYSITWRMISSKIHFRKQPPFRGNFFPFRCDIFCFFEFILASWQFSRPRLPCFHTSN